MMATHYDLEKPAMQARVVGMIASGLKDQAIAEKVSTPTRSFSRQAIHSFRKRHSDLIEPVVGEIVRQISGNAIADKVNRVAELQQLYDATCEYLAAEGLVAVEDTRHGHRRTYRGDAVRTAAALLRQAAEELDQLPRAGITVNNQNVVIVKQVS